MFVIPAYSEQHDSVNCVCPYCKNSYQVEGEDISEEEQEIECDECGKSFYLSSIFDVTHSTVPACELNNVQHTWELQKNEEPYYICSICGKIKF